MFILDKWKRPETSAHRLREAMSITGKKQADLVRETGLNRGTISRYLSGEYEPKQAAIKKLAAALGVAEMWLWGYDVPMERAENKEEPATDNGSGLSESQRELMRFAEGLSEEEAAQVLQTMKLLVQGLRK